MYSPRLPHTVLFQPCLLVPKQLHSKGAELAPKAVLYFTHRNGLILGAKTDLFDLQLKVEKCLQKTCFEGYLRVSLTVLYDDFVTL